MSRAVLRVSEVVSGHQDVSRVFESWAGLAAAQLDARRGDNSCTGSSERVLNMTASGRHGFMSRPGKVEEGGRGEGREGWGRCLRYSGQVAPSLVCPSSTFLTFLAFPRLPPFQFN